TRFENPEFPVAKRTETLRATIPAFQQGPCRVVGGFERRRKFYVPKVAVCLQTFHAPIGEPPGLQAAWPDDTEISFAQVLQVDNADRVVRRDTMLERDAGSGPVDFDGIGIFRKIPCAPAKRRNADGKLEENSFRVPSLVHNTCILDHKRKGMVGLGRFELPTHGLGNRCSIHLSYRPMAPNRWVLIE